MARGAITSDGALTRPVGASRTRRLVAGALALAAATALTACGSATIGDLPPAAEPARAPELAQEPIGRTIRVGGMPEGVVVDPRSHYAAVALRDPDRLRIIDLPARRIVKDVALPGAPRHLSLQDTPEGARVLVPAETGRRFLSVALPSGEVVAEAPTGDHPHDLAALAGGDVAVGDERGNTLTLVRGSKVERTVPIATQPGGLATLRGGSLLAIVSVRERVLEILDAKTLQRVAIGPAGVGPTHVVCAPEGPCFVADTQGDALLVFRVGEGGKTLRLTRRVYVAGAPYGIAIDPEAQRLWVSLTARNELLELPAHGHPHILERYPTVRQPDTVGVDSTDGTVVVTGRANGLLQVITAQDRAAASGG